MCIGVCIDLFFDINLFNKINLLILFIDSYYRQSSISQSLLQFTENHYNQHLPALACILTSTDTPKNIHAYGGTFGVCAVRSYGYTPNET